MEDVYGSDMIDILATANDGTVEAFSVKRRNNVIAVKWHPELMMGNKCTYFLFLLIYLYLIAYYNIEIKEIIYLASML